MDDNKTDMYYLLTEGADEEEWHAEYEEDDKCRDDANASENKEEKDVPF